MSYLVSRENGETIYSQISKALRSEILQHYRLGDCLPAEPQLAERFAVNRHTLRRAVDVLVAEGIVQRRHGRGTFVTAPLQYPITQGTRFTENLAKISKNIETLLLRKLIIPARGGVAEKLGLDIESPVIWLETLRMVEDLPFCITLRGGKDEEAVF
ncbi:MAG: GntR family transcriptional regulator [Syntrophobacteraceae bacterium]